MYTGMVFDIHDKDVQSLTKSDFQHPTYSFDIMDLFFLGDFMEMHDLVKILQENFVTPRSMFSSPSFKPEESEKMVSSMLARCSGSENPSLVYAIASAYAKATGGMCCLCRFPTQYSQTVWDMMMNAGKEFRVLWMAHVLPIYVVRFDLSPDEGMQLFASMEVQKMLQRTPSGSGSASTPGVVAAAAPMWRTLMNAANASSGVATNSRGSLGSKVASSLLLRDVMRGVNREFLSDPHKMGCMFLDPLVQVPDTRSIQALYLSHFGIDLATEYKSNQPLIGFEEDSGSGQNTFMHQYINLLHVVGSAAQLLLSAREQKNSKILPK